MDHGKPSSDGDRRTLFRVVYEEFLDDPIPSRSPRGRFHDTDRVPGTTTYLAATPETAWTEVASRWQANPGAYRMCEIEVDVQRIVDLTDPNIQDEYGLEREQLTAPDHSACRGLAVRLRREEVEAVWTYSAADPNGRVLVVFVDLLRPDSEIRVKEIREIEFD